MRYYLLKGRLGGCKYVNLFSPKGQTEKWLEYINDIFNPPSTKIHFELTTEDVKSILEYHLERKK